MRREGRTEMWEWQESALDGTNDDPDESRIIRGGSMNQGEESMRASVRRPYEPGFSNYSVGLRVASVVPEPSTRTLLGLGLPTLLGLSRFRRGAS